MPLDSVTQLVEDLVEAWNLGDASAFAGLFTPDAEYVTGTGHWLQGREAIAALLKSGTTQPRVQVEGAVSARDHGPVASIIFRWAADVGDGPRRRGVVTCLLVRIDERWLIDRLHNVDTI